jgi:hypothetical protein
MDRAAFLRLLFVLVVALVIGCAPGPSPCTTPGTCGSGEECLANRCVPLGTDPVAADTRRLLFVPHALAVVSARGERADGLPGAVTFGSRSTGASALYLSYAIGFDRIRAVDSAFLVLEPLPMSAHTGDSVEVDAWRIAENWDRESISWLTQPALAPPRARGVAQSGPLNVLRVDVSAIVRFWLGQPMQNRGMALKASSGDGHGLSFATGASDGAAPRLELYVR